MVAFVLSGGASLGAIEAGMLQALYEHGISPDLIVGTSAGAVNGAFIASRPATPATAQELEALWREMCTLQVFPPNPVTAGLGGHDAPAEAEEDLLARIRRIDVGKRADVAQPGPRRRLEPEFVQVLLIGGALAGVAS